MIAPRTPAHDRLDLARFVEYLAVRHNEQVPLPQFRFHRRITQPRVGDWQFTDPHVTEPPLTPHMASPSEYFHVHSGSREDDINNSADEVLQRD